MLLRCSYRFYQALSGCAGALAGSQDGRPMLLGCKFIFEDTQTIYLYLDAVAGLDGSYSRRSSGGNQVAGFEGGERGDVAEQRGNGEDEVAGRSLLLDDAVEAGDHGDRSAADGVNFVRDDGADGAEGVEALAARPLAVGLLDVAGGDVVDADVAANVGADVLVGADLAATAGDDDAEFSLVIDACGDGRHADDAIVGE